MLNLIGLNGKAEGEFYTLMDGESTIGRDEDNQVCVDEVSFSSHHVEITVKDDHFTAKDLGSTNGCTLNKQKFTEGILKHNDLLCVGSIVFKVIDPREVMKEKAEAEKEFKKEKQKADETVLAVPAVPAAAPVEKAEAAETPAQKTPEPEVAPVNAGENATAISDAAPASIPVPPAPAPAAPVPPAPQAASAVPPPAPAIPAEAVVETPVEEASSDSEPDSEDASEAEEEAVALPGWVASISRAFLWLIVLALFVKHILNIVS